MGLTNSLHDTYIPNSYDSFHFKLNSEFARFHPNNILIVTDVLNIMKKTNKYKLYLCKDIPTVLEGIIKLEY